MSNKDDTGINCFFAFSERLWPHGEGSYLGFLLR